MGNGTINIEEVELIICSDCLARSSKELRGVKDNVRFRWKETVSGNVLSELCSQVDNSNKIKNKAHPKYLSDP